MPLTAPMLALPGLATDRATFAWWCDVFVNSAYRGRGLGRLVTGAATSHPDVAGMRQVLMAKPERSICRRLGFRVLGGPEILSIFGRPGGQMRVRAKAGQRVGGTP